MYIISNGSGWLGCTFHHTLRTTILCLSIRKFCFCLTAPPRLPPLFLQFPHLFSLPIPQETSIYQASDSSWAKTLFILGWHYLYFSNCRTPLQSPVFWIIFTLFPPLHVNWSFASEVGIGGFIRSPYGSVHSLEGMWSDCLSIQIILGKSKHYVKTKIIFCFKNHRLMFLFCFLSYFDFYISYLLMCIEYKLCVDTTFRA